MRKQKQRIQVKGYILSVRKTLSQTRIVFLQSAKSPEPMRTEKKKLKKYHCRHYTTLNAKVQQHYLAIFKKLGLFFALCSRKQSSIVALVEDCSAYVHMPVYKYACVIVCVYITNHAKQLIMNKGKLRIHFCKHFHVQLYISNQSH